MRDDHFVAGTRSGGGGTELNVIINIKLFSLNLGTFDDKWYILQFKQVH